MMQFDNYRWEDRVPQPGRWKYDLALAAMAFAALTLVLPPDPAKDSAPALARSTPSPLFSSAAASEPADVGATSGAGPSRPISAFCSEATS